jgi:hypothetical protein
MAENSEPAEMAFHGAADSCSAAMDELAAAASVLAMDIDSESDDGLGLGPGPVECGGGTCRSSTFETSAADKENELGVPSSSLPGAVHEKVSKAAYALVSMPHA